MTTEQIEKFIENKMPKGSVMTIHFKDRQTVSGLFIRMPDYGELKSKNLWRVVRTSSLDEWEKTRNPHLNRIFKGVTFSRISVD